MKKALISTNEPRQYFDGSQGYRIAQVEDETNTFAVAEGLYWIECNDDVVADQFYFDTLSSEIKLVPVYVPPPKEQPASTGMTEL